MSIEINITTIGDVGVGKTSIALKYIYGELFEGGIPTMGVDLLKKQISILDDSKQVLINIWDTGSFERFRMYPENLFKKSDGIFVVFDLSNKDTFMNLQDYIDQIQEVNMNAAIVLVGNKSDLTRKVSKEKAQEFANLNSIEYFETSAKLNINIDEAFKYLAEKAFRQMPDKVENGIDISSKDQNNENGGWKC